jgi:DnaK suppressor protein
MLTNNDTVKFKKLLEEEKSLLETELSELGSRNPGNPSDWMPSKPAGDEFGADRNDNADIIEDMQDNNAALNELEGRLNQVISALAKISEGTYGTCDIGGETIEMERLQANPAAATCKKHMHA